VLFKEKRPTTVHVNFFKTKREVISTLNPQSMMMDFEVAQKKLLIQSSHHLM
jgi:hypothetical protein